MYGEQIKKANGQKIECHFDDYFESRIREFEKRSGIPNSSGAADNGAWRGGAAVAPPPPMPGISMNTPATPNVVVTDAAAAQNGAKVENPSFVTPKNEGSPKMPGLSGSTTGSRRLGKNRGRKPNIKSNASSAHASSADEYSPARKGKGHPGSASNKKKARKWDADGNVDESGDVVLDYSSQKAASTDEEGDVSRVSASEHVGTEAWGTKTSKGQFILKDIEDEIDDILSTEDKNDKAANGDKKGFLTGVGFGALGYLRNFVGGKVLTKEDTDKAIAGIHNHLLEKNVAREAVVQICDNVQQTLLGQKTGNFQSAYSHISFPSYLEIFILGVTMIS